MKIVFYNKSLVSGGIEKCIEILAKCIYNKCELEVVYTDASVLDLNIVKILEQYAKVYKVEDGMTINCDYCVWCYLYFDYAKLKRIIHAKSYITWIHSMPRILPDCLLDNVDFINDTSKFICVSEAVKNNLNIGKKGEIIHNLMDDSIIKKANEFNPFEDSSADELKLVVVSRLSRGKGFDRLLLLCDSLKRNEVDFHIMIVGKGRSWENKIRNSFSGFSEVEFLGYQENPYPYIKNADYLVQLSDDESWCNSITESKILKTPVVVTNFESSKEQITHLKNGIIVDLDETNYDQCIKLMLENRVCLKNNLMNFSYINEIEKWKEVFQLD